MSEHNYHLYKITALTNLHVGSGEANFGVVDNLVQKDYITGYPAIFSSSLKGALREFYISNLNEDESDKDKKSKYIFGSNDNNGAYRFFQANLLSLPLRSNKIPYFLCLSEQIISNLENSLKNFILDKERCKDILTNLKSVLSIFMEKKENDFEAFFSITDNLDISSDENVRIEDNKAIRVKNEKSVEGLRNLLVSGNDDDYTICYNKNIAFINHEIFKNYTKNLPVIARNHLDNGQSENLWYEEIVPRFSMFYFYIGVPIKDEKNGFFDEFNNLLENNIVQIGANATIGNGYCKINKLL